jgi:hypothetical protein
MPREKLRQTKHYSHPSDSTTHSHNNFIYVLTSFNKRFIVQLTGAKIGKNYDVGKKKSCAH